MNRKTFLAFVVAFLLVFNLTPFKHTTHAQQPPAPPDQQQIMAHIMQIAGSYGFDQQTFMQLVGELQTSRDPQALAGILDKYGVDSLTLNAFIDDLNKAGLAPALGTMLDLSLVGDVASALDDLAAEQFLADAGITEDDLATWLAELAATDPSSVDLAALGWEAGDLLYFLYALDVIDSFDDLELAAGFDDEGYYQVFIVSVDPETLLAFYGIDEAFIDELLAGADFSDPTVLADYLWSMGIDPDSFGELVDAFSDDAFFTDLLTQYTIDLATLDALVAEIEFQEMLTDYGMTEEEFNAFVEELIASGDYDALMAAYGLSLDDIDGLLSDLDDLDTSLLDLAIALDDLQAQLDDLEAQINEMEVEQAGEAGSDDAGGDTGSGDTGGDTGTDDAGSGDAGGDASSDDASGDDAGGDDAGGGESGGEAGGDDAGGETTGG